MAGLSLYSTLSLLRRRMAGSVGLGRRVEAILPCKDMRVALCRIHSVRKEQHLNCLLQNLTYEFLCHARSAHVQWPDAYIRYHQKSLDFTNAGERSSGTKPQPSRVTYSSAYFPEQTSPDQRTAASESHNSFASKLCWCPRSPPSPRHQH